MPSHDALGVDSPTTSMGLDVLRAHPAESHFAQSRGRTGYTSYPVYDVIANALKHALAAPSVSP